MRRSVALVLALLLAACSSTPPPRLPPAPRPPLDDAGAAVSSRLIQALLAQGFRVTSDPSGTLIRGERAEAPADWFDCPSVVVNDPDPKRSRRAFVRPDGASTLVEAQVGPVGARERVDLDVTMTGLYRNHFDRVPFRRPCASTGVIEAQLRAAAAG